MDDFQEKRSKEDRIPMATPSLVPLRLHVKGLQPTITADDLRQLFAKFKGCQVEEVYLPPAPLSSSSSSSSSLMDCMRWKSGFAIVRLSLVEEGEGQKIVKALSGSSWKGSRIVLSRAKEFYKDKLAREQAIATATATTAGAGAGAAIAKGGLSAKPPPPPPAAAPAAPVALRPFQGSYLVMRRARGLPKMKVSPEPLLRFQGKWYRRRGTPGTTLAPLSAHHILFSEMDKQRQGEEEEERLIDLDAFEEVAAPVPKREKGVRKGFGSLLRAPLPTPPPPPAAAPPGRLHSDELLQKGDLEIEESMQEEGVMGLKEQALEENLAADRERSLRVMQALLASKPPPPPPATRTAALPPTVAAVPTITTAPPSADQKPPRKELREGSTRSSTTTPFSPAPSVNEHVEEKKEEEEAKKSFADTSQLKSIFHRSDGVHWGASDDLKEGNQVLSGAVAQEEDRIFLAAEKLGLDVRAAAPLSSSSLSRPPSGAMVFNFFGAANAEKEEEVEKEEKGVSASSASEALLVWSDLVQLSLAFQRDQKEEEVQAAWRTNRERLVRDYKKKRREMQKRSGNKKRRRLGG
eukprot:gene7248-8017_t